MNYLDLAIKNNYFIKVENKNSNSCLVTFPKNIFLNKEEERLIYTTTKNGVETLNEKFESLNKFDCPEYAKRVIINFDILTKGLKLKIPCNFVVTFKKGEIVFSNFDFIKIENKDKEDLLRKSLTFIFDRNDYTSGDEEIDEILQRVKNNFLEKGDVIC